MVIASKEGGLWRPLTHRCHKKTPPTHPHVPTPLPTHRAIHDRQSYGKGCRASVGALPIALPRAPPRYTDANTSRRRGVLLAEGMQISQQQIDRKTTDPELNQSANQNARPKTAKGGGHGRYGAFDMALTLTTNTRAQSGLRIWLFFVAGLRLLSVAVALMRPETLASTVFAAAPLELTALGARVFASWTLTTSFLIMLCAKEGAEPSSSVYTATAFSFVVALALFLPELAYYQTMTFWSAASPMIIASTSLVWMGVVRWPGRGAWFSVVAAAGTATVDPAPPYNTVITFGTFDVLHYGHIRILQRARALGHRLVVGVSSDELNMSKKSRAPIYSFEQRKLIIESLGCVDEVFAEESLEKKADYCLQFGADVLVMGDDWEGKFDELCHGIGISAHYLKRTPAISTTETIEVIKAMQTK